MNLERSRSAAARGIERRGYLGVDLAVSLDGGPPSGFRLGSAGGALWTCAAKCLLAVGIATLVSRSVLSFDDPLGLHLPELSGSGWDQVPLRDVLSHSVGVTADPGVLSVCLPDDEVLRRIAAAPPDPGQDRGAYTVWTGAFLLGQVIRAATGERHDSYLLREIAAPLGLRDTVLVYPRLWLPLLADQSRPLLAAAGLPGPSSANAKKAEKAEKAETEADIGRWVRRDRVWAGVSASGPMSDLVRVLAALLPGRAQRTADGPAPLVCAQVAREVTTVRRPAKVASLSENSLAWGLGVAVDRRLGSPRCSRATFGHFGLNGAVVAFADPDRDLVAAIRLTGVGAVPGTPLRRAALIEALLADTDRARPQCH